MNQLKRYFLMGILIGTISGFLIGGILATITTSERPPKTPEVVQTGELGDLEARINVTDSVLSAEITRLNNLLGVLAPWSQGVNARLDSLTAICQGLR